MQHEVSAFVEPDFADELTSIAFVCDPEQPPIATLRRLPLAGTSKNTKRYKPRKEALKYRKDTAYDPAELPDQRGAEFLPSCHYFMSLLYRYTDPFVEYSEKFSYLKPGLILGHHADALEAIPHLWGSERLREFLREAENLPSNFHGYRYYGNAGDMDWKLEPLHEACYLYFTHLSEKHDVYHKHLKRLKVAIQKAAEVSNG